MAANTNMTQPFAQHNVNCAPELPRVRAVVIDDSRAMVRAIQTFLESTGRVENVGTANNGRLAIELVETLRPDLVVMDVNMPEMNGLLATTAIKNVLPETKILVVSSDDDPAIALAALDSGADDFMPKMNLPSLTGHVARMFPERFCLE